MLNLKTIDTAGGLVVDRQERILFIFKCGRWDLPKGLVDRKNTAEVTAAKEVSEETGLPLDKLRVAMELIPTTHISKFNKERSLKLTRWFLVRYSGKEIPFKPQIKEGIQHCEWIPEWDLDRPLANCPARVHYLVRFWTKARKEMDLVW